MFVKEGTLQRSWAALGAGTMLAAFAFLAPSSVDAATLFITPGTGSYRPDQSFTVTVRTNTQGANVNAAEAVLRFDPARLRVESVSGDNTIFNLNVQQPDFSNTAGTVTFAGVVLNPGYTGASGNLLNITFRGRVAGQTSVTFASGAVLANDGAGTNVLAGTSGATFTIIGGPTPTPTPVPSGTPAPETETDPLLPIITSTTHPDEDSWYPSSTVVLAWPLPNDVTGASWLVDPKPDGNPGNLLDGLVDTVTFDDVEDGETYFHLKLQRNGRFGPTGHYGIRIDTVPPEPFEIVRIKEGDPTEPQPWLLYETTDVTSGIQKYRMRIGEGDWFEVPEATPERPYRLPLQAPGTHQVVVEAIDGAGLIASSQYTLVVASIPVPVITAPTDGAAWTTLDVSGRAQQDSTITVRAYRVDRSGHVSDEATALAGSALSGPNGTWRTTFRNVMSGIYELEATATDARGAVSFPSERVTVTAGSLPLRIFYRAWHWLFSIPFWLLWLLVAFLTVNLFFVLFRYRRRARRPMVAAVVTDRDPRIIALIEDVEQELGVLKRLKRSRPLYPEEKHLSQKLDDYHRELVKIAKTGVSRPRKEGKATSTKRKAVKVKK